MAPRTNCNKRAGAQGPDRGIEVDAIREQMVDAGIADILYSLFFFFSADFAMM